MNTAMCTIVGTTYGKLCNWQSTQSCMKLWLAVR